MLPKILSFLSVIHFTFGGILAPCNESDYDCIGYILSENSSCERQIWGSVPNIVGYNNFQFETPYFNATYIDQYTIVKNLDKCFVSTFFFDLEESVAVLSISCPDLIINASRGMIQHVDQGQDLYYDYHITQTFPGLSMTANLLHPPRLDICNNYVYTYLDGLPIYKLKAYNAASQQYILSIMDATNREKSIYFREQMRYYAQPLFQLFVNSMLCDFDQGCSIIQAQS